MDYSIKLPLFEGPLDLLLHLIKKEEVDIYDIPVARIADQYLEYIEMMKELNLDIAGEFLLMAATLIHIKSRMLLPVDEESAAEIPQDDPRFELVQRLLEYQAFKEASFALREKEDAWSAVFYRDASSGEGQGKQIQTDAPLSAGDPGNGEDMLFPEMTGPEGLDLADLNMFDLLTAFRKLLDKAPPEVVAITRETLTVKDRISFILEKLDRQDAVRFEDLFTEGTAKTYLIVTFIALLEVIRLGLVRAYQERDFGRIWIIRKQEAGSEASSGH